jgi:AcrR family transcriptional regulator
MPASPIPANRGERRRLRTRAALIEAARRVFAARGVDAATVQEITEAADVAKGSFYNHFASKEDALRAVVTATLDELGATLDRSLDAGQRDPARVLAASLHHTLRSCVEDPVLGWFVLRSAGLAEAAQAALGARGRRDLARGRDAGRFRFDDLELTATAIAGAAEAVLRARLRGELSEAAELRLLEMVLRLLDVPADEARSITAELDTTPRDAAVAGGAGQ